jgi:WD40 repeat protein
VYSFTWSTTCKQLASCGLERTISLWNPYTRNPKPLAILSGHTSSVLHVAINDEGFQLFSCSVDKCIKVWDLRSHKCMQTIHDKTAYRPEDRITAMTYDPAHCRLLTGTTKLRVWPLVKAAKRSTKPKHEHPLCAALYNKNFHQIVSGDESAQVCVWDVERGEMVFHFTELHQAKMMSMAFDEAGRRLITGANDGTVRVWNFSNGQCLQQLKNDSQLEVSCITFIVESQNKFIVAGGWNRKVLVWRDEASSSSAAVEPDRMMVGHDEDILSIAYSPPNLLATSGYDGRLLIWNMDSAILKFSLTTVGVEHRDVDQRAMWKLIFLEKRSQALVSGSADGKLRFWNVKEGLMVWEHDAQHKNRDVVAMATEPTNSFLFTGDGAGYLKIWDICQFLNVAKLDQRSNIIELAHWRAHDGYITSLDYIERHKLILSSSTDTRIKMWRFVNGVSLASVVLGEHGPAWNLSDQSTFEPVEQEEHSAAAPAAKGAAPATDADDSDAPVSKPDGAARPSLAKRESRAPDMPQHKDTQDLIHQILSGRSNRKGALTQPTFRSLRTHDLATISPRGEEGGGRSSKRGVGLPR